jgi:hypothetical protein
VVVQVAILLLVQVVVLHSTQLVEPQTHLILAHQEQVQEHLLMQAVADLLETHLLEFAQAVALVLELQLVHKLHFQAVVV